MKKANQGKSQDTHKSVNQERIAYVMSCLIGNEVSIHMKDGNEIKGFFHAYNCAYKGNKKEIDISLNYARILPKKDQVSGPINKAMIIPENLYTMIVGKNLNLDLKDPDDIKSVKGKFQIDADISEKRKKYNSNTANRELKRWVCDNSNFNENKLKLDHNLKEPWDQFEHNRKLYGVTTTYKEELYTTNLDVNKIPHHVKMHADKIAKELENRGMHLDPEDAERDNKDLDEEDLFGAVRQNKDKFVKNFKCKKEDGKGSQPQGKFHQFTIRNLKEKIQSGNSDIKEKNEDSSKLSDNKNAEFIGINALNLEPALPRLDEKTRTEWIMFKNKAKNKISNKKDKLSEKQEFIIAAKEFNEKLANKMNANTQESQTEVNNDQTQMNNPPPEIQTTVSNLTDEIKSQDNENTIIKSKSASFTNSSMRPYDAYVLNFNNISNLNSFNTLSSYNNMNNPSNFSNANSHSNVNSLSNVNNLSIANDPNHFNHVNHFSNMSNFNHMNKYRPILTQFPNTINQIYVPPDLYVRKNVGTQPLYNKYPHNRKYQKELHPFTVRGNGPKKQFDTLMNNTLKNSKREDSVKSPIQFRNTKQHNYKNDFRGTSPHAPVHIYKEANYFPSNTPVQPNMSSILVNVPVVPVVQPTTSGPFIEHHPHYYNPYFRSHYPNSSISANSNGSFIYNIPITNIDRNYSSNKNMDLYPLGNPHVPNLHVPNSHEQFTHVQNAPINFPVTPYIATPSMNYAVTTPPTSLNIANNANLPNPNINVSSYPPEFVIVNPHKYPNSQTVPVPVFPQYQYQNYYPSSTHGMKNS
ncbi:ataxin-2 like protein [Plasmodium gonderi]|uniref:Ataxin-2 like protein n=1 Tax=Plasmodium gonderi TaxID=77519 RepID=A0A1Y1JK58_PLAGO|nr:ataxin-2 like protein [Plasmodium gonderi]GAW82879.1 ataxin-2 like protein [Plasmodium gonderi]